MEKDYYKDYMMQLAPWQLFVTCRFKPDIVESEKANKLLKIFCRDVSKQFGFRISSIGVINQDLSFTHSHILMYGVNKYKNTIIELIHDDIKALWAYYIDVRNIYDLANMVNYIVDKNMKREFELFDYGLKHLVK